MKCPKDAYIEADNEHDCNAEHNKKGIKFTCTRPKGHKGKHHAHDLIGQCCKVW